MDKRPQTDSRSKTKLYQELFNKVQTHLQDPDIVNSLTASVDLDEPAREQVGSSGLELLIQLKVKKTFTSENVDGLLGALVDCNQKTAAQLVKEYIDETGIPSKVPVPDLSNIDSGPGICTEHGDPMELLCNTCNETICFGCAFYEHRDHEVISEDDCEQKVEEAEKEFEQKSNALVETINAADLLLQSANADVKTSRDHINRSFNTWSGLIANHKDYIEINLQKRILKKSKQIKAFEMNISKTVGGFRKQVSKLTGVNEGIEGAVQLKMWRELHKAVTEAMEIFQTHKNDLNAYDQPHCTYLPISEIGRCVNMSCGSTVGCISVDEESAIIVRDNRNFGNGVSACCMVTANRERVHWKTVLGKQIDKYPIVLSHDLFVTGIKPAKALIACGNSLTVISVANGRGDFKNFETETKSLDIPEGSYITVMTPTVSTNRHTGVLVAENTSVVLHELNIDLKQIKTLDCTGCVQSISHMGCSDDLVAIIDAVADEVVLIGTKQEPSIRGKLKPPHSKIKLLPKFVQWDGNLWGLIWESTSNKDDKGPEWMHRSYHENGKDLNIDVQSGVCERNANIVALSFFRLTSVVCFSNGKTVTYPSHPAAGMERKPSATESESSASFPEFSGSGIDPDILKRLWDLIS